MEGATLSASECADFIRGAGFAVALTGAGISTAAGIPDFRGPGGLYTTGRYDPEKTFTIEGFLRDPREFFRFSRDLLELAGDLEPTFTHRFLVGLEEAGRLEAVITQNIDPLHQRAGSRRVLAVHGSYATGRCLACGREYGFERLAGMIREAEVPRCSCPAGGVVKPDVVLFGEPVGQMEEAAALAGMSDLLLVLGSSLAVAPAGALPALAGGKVMVVNQGPVALAPGPGRHFAERPLDEFFREVAACLGMGP